MKNNDLTPKSRKGITIMNDDIKVIVEKQPELTRIFKTNPLRSNGVLWPEVALTNNDINRLKMTINPYHIKVNLPSSKEKYESGNGEGVWVIIDETTKKDYDSDITGGIYHGILDNDSFDYPRLKCGSYIRFEMRGNNRPVALL